MSYILEALKKAQAERQLGSSPTIHAPTLQAAATSSQGSRFGKPLIAALVAMGVVIVVLLALVLRSRGPATPAAAPVADLPPSVANLARASTPEPQAQPAVVPLPVSVPTAGAAPTKPPVPEDPVANLRDLPEPIQRAIPQIAVGGYIYSKNPADRVLLIDKVLRHEGDEVAPGLVLEKLQAKEAIFGFKGYRYRVPY